MSDSNDGLPSGVDPSNPGVPNDSSLGADRAAAIEAEKQRWRERSRRAGTPAPKSGKASKKAGKTGDAENLKPEPLEPDVFFDE